MSTDDELTKKIKKKLYYTEYYKLNRDRLLEYQHKYNLTHNEGRKKQNKVSSNNGRLAVTRTNIAKRLEQQAKRVAEFKLLLAHQAANNNAI